MVRFRSPQPGDKRAEERVKPSRWPVFVRTEGNHDRPLTDLLPDWDSVRRALDDAIEQGIPAASLLIVEYAAEPVAEGLFRKLSSFRIGDRICATTAVHEDSWLVKYGKKGIAGEALYDDELQIVRENRYADEIAHARGRGNRIRPCRFRYREGSAPDLRDQYQSRDKVRQQPSVPAT